MNLALRHGGMGRLGFGRLGSSRLLLSFTFIGSGPWLFEWRPVLYWVCLPGLHILLLNSFMKTNS